MASEAGPRGRRLGPSRAEVLEYLRDAAVAEPIAAIAEAVGLHENTTRFHLDALIDAGLVLREAESRQQPGRPRVLYRADPAPSEAGYQELATAMVRHFAGPMHDRAGRAVIAGQAWGAELRAELVPESMDALPRMVRCLTRLGYEPELVPGSPPSITVRPCPYSALTLDSDTVCQLHLGLMRGLLDAADPWDVTALEPYATPERCVVHLQPREHAS